VAIPDDAGKPDGLTVDAYGGVWVALHGGSAVHRYTADGRLDEVVEVPVGQVTACTLGGPDLDQLYVTTSREGLEDDEEPVAGSLFRATVGVRGRPVRAFAG
jgi:sugar lactone lactonase YvrE